MSALAGVRWAFAQGAGGIGSGVVVIGIGGIRVCTNAGINGRGEGARGCAGCRRGLERV